MTGPLRCWISLFLAALFFRNAVHGARNFTVDDSDLSINYTGTWHQNSSPFAVKGSHAFSEDRNATATFTFTGVAIYYEAPMWAYAVNTRLTLDSDPPIVVNMTSSHAGTKGDPEVTQSKVLWGKSGLSNTNHTLVASMSFGGDYVVVDALIYTVLDPSDISSSSPADSTPVPSIPMGTLYAKLSAIIGVIAGLLILLFLFCRPIRKAIESQYRRRRKQAQSAYSTDHAVLHDGITSLQLRGTSSREPSKSPYSDDTLPQRRQLLRTISATKIPPPTASNSEYGSALGIPSTPHHIHLNIGDSVHQQNTHASLTPSVSLRTASMLSEFSLVSRASEDPVELYHAWSLLYGYRPSTPPIIRTQDEVIVDIASRKSESTSLPGLSLHPSSIRLNDSQLSRNGAGKMAQSQDYKESP